MTLYLFDDTKARAWAPFATTRPVGELLMGCLLLRERAERFWGAPCAGHLVDPTLDGFQEAGSPPAFSDLPSDDGDYRVFFSSRAVPDLAAAVSIEEPARLVMEGQTVGWIAPPGSPSPTLSDLLDPGASEGPGSVVEVAGRVLEHPWDLMAQNGDQVRKDISAIFPESRFSLPEGVHCTGQGRISIGHGVELEAGVHLDATNGPIRLSDNTRVLAFTRLAGPAFIGTGSQLLGGAFGSVSIGPHCKVRGEVADSVMLGYSNKAHDGFLGHSYLGRWVNLGALTTTSDLKNNYGTVRVVTNEGPVDTGLLKVGSMIGDHAKTGIGTLLSTGAVVGAGSNIFGGALAPRFVPAFSWGSGQTLDEYDLDRFLEVAQRTMERRDVELDDDAKAVLKRAWEKTRSDRS